MSKNQSAFPRITIQIFNSEAPVIFFNLIGWGRTSIFLLSFLVIYSGRGGHNRLLKGTPPVKKNVFFRALHKKGGEGLARIC